MTEENLFKIPAFFHVVWLYTLIEKHIFEISFDGTFTACTWIFFGCRPSAEPQVGVEFIVRPLGREIKHGATVLIVSQIWKEVKNLVWFLSPTPQVFDWLDFVYVKLSNKIYFQLDSN